MFTNPSSWNKFQVKRTESKKIQNLIFAHRHYVIFSIFFDFSNFFFQHPPPTGLLILIDIGDSDFFSQNCFFPNSKCVPATEKQKTSPGSPAYTCQCQENFEHDPVLGICVDINECADPSNNPCSSLGADVECINRVGSHRCKCPMGFEYNILTQKCDDVDECEFSSLYRGLSKIGGCVDVGWTLFGRYLDVTQDFFHDLTKFETCLLYCDHGPEDNVCVNYPGSFSCECGKGYAEYYEILK